MEIAEIDQYVCLLNFHTEKYGYAVLFVQLDVLYQTVKLVTIEYFLQHLIGFTWLHET